MRAIVLGLVATLALAGCGDAGLPNVNDTQATTTTSPPAGGASSEPNDPELSEGEIPISQINFSEWELLYAEARASLDATGPVEFSSPGASCSVLAAADDQVILITNFAERPEARTQAPYFSYTDRGDGFAIWGLYIGSGGEQGQEWSGTGQGTPALSATLGEVAGGAGLIIQATWSGQANENFTSEKSGASLEIECIFVPPTE